MNYYNECDPQAAEWIRHLISNKLIPDGVVDERRIQDVEAKDIEGFTQCHFFAGIAGWSQALTLAGWPTTRRVWTGSCPCQPFSAAGNRKAQADERHLWPDFFRLIRECRPQCVFGEQVEGAIRHGWLDGVCADLEGEGYSVGHCVLGAHSVGSPHIRQRLYWVADSGQSERGRRADERKSAGEDSGEWREEATDDQRRSAVGGVGDSGERALGASGGETGFWSDSVIIPCRDGKWRRVPAAQPGVLPVADGLPAGMDDERVVCGDRFPLAGAITGRVALLRGAGNAIVPQVAAAFIEAYMESRRERS